MPRVIERTVYKFSELSDKAKEAAREKERSTERHDDWWDAVYEDAVTCADLLGISIDERTERTSKGRVYKNTCIFFSGFWSQGDGASFTGHYSSAPNIVERISEHAPLDTELRSIAEGLTLLQVTTRLKNGGTLNGIITTSGRYSHSGTMECSATYIDPNGNDSEPTEEVTKDLLVLMRRFADWIYSQLEEDDEYLSSNECIDERLADDEFDEDGALI